MEKIYQLLEHHKSSWHCGMNIQIKQMSLRGAEEKFAIKPAI